MNAIASMADAADGILTCLDIDCSDCTFDLRICPLLNISIFTGLSYAALIGVLSIETEGNKRQNI